ncbi:olfactory receptor 4B13-like [Hyperolius riggenbachi]|uniref:olfactory receptor 4B13-like n=1 Tax=Hyperolius riggenbachi TaxID=752182 RepID=UPI0035A2F8D6
MGSRVNSSAFVFLGLVEMEELHYLYCALATVAYLFILTLSVAIVFVVLTEPSLHEPMYILIGNLVLNGLIGSTAVLPKLIVDLITSTKHISYDLCVMQCLATALFAMYEMRNFTIMACDRYLAVCYPLHYNTLMTKEKTMKLIAGCWIFSFVLALTGILLTWNLTLCGDKINNIFCDNMSLVALSCSDSSISRLVSATGISMCFVVTILVTIFSYVNIFVTCSKLSKESRQKAFHTLMTHLINFSIFLVGIFFIVIRYRLGNVQLSLTVHVLLSITPMVFPPVFNPLIYGVRTHALKMNVLKYFWKLQLETKSLKQSSLKTVTSWQKKIKN